MSVADDVLDDCNDKGGERGTAGLMNASKRPFGGSLTDSGACCQFRRRLVGPTNDSVSLEPTLSSVLRPLCRSIWDRRTSVFLRSYVQHGTHSSRRQN